MSVIFILIVLLLGLSLSILLLYILLKDDPETNYDCTDEKIQEIIQSKRDIREKVNKIKIEKKKD